MKTKIASLFFISLFLLSFIVPSLTYATWEQQTDVGPLYLYDYTYSPDGTYLIAISGNNNYLYSSTDGGLSWRRANLDVLDLYNYVYSPDGSSLVATSGTDGYVYTSIDNGATWTKNESAGSLNLYYYTYSLNGEILLATSDNDGYTYISLNDGIDWTPQTEVGSLYLYNYTYSPDGISLIATSDYDGYTYISLNDGIDWTPQTEVGSLYLYDYIYSPDGTYLISTNDSGEEDSGYTYISTDNGITWDKQTDVGPLYLFFYTYSPDGTSLIATSTSGEGSYGYTYISQDNGVTWEKQELLGPLYLYNYTYSPDGISLIATSDEDGYTYISTDGGGDPSFFANGDGRESDPYQIETCQQLQDINYTPDDGATYPFLRQGYHFILNNDIDCSDTENWNGGLGFMPLGRTYNVDENITYGDYFYGFFDGNGKTISNLYINRPNFENVGLFGSVLGNMEDELESVIENINLENVNITGKYYVGGLVGTSSYSHIEGASVSGSVTGVGAVGGLVGSHDTGLRTITDSHSSANVYGSYNLGGLVGENYNSNIYNSYATGDVVKSVDIDSGDGIGGLVGYNSRGNIHSSYATGDVYYSVESINTEMGFGGLVGMNVNGHIENTYATGNVSGLVSGGLVGVSGADTGEGPVTIVNSYATGDVEGVIAGGLVGMNYTDKIYNSYATGNVSTAETEASGGLIGALFVNEGETANDYIFNSGWYKSSANSDLSGIGYVYDNNGGFSNINVSYAETDESKFYSKSHGIYKNAVEYEWIFGGDPWCAYSSSYPLLLVENCKETSPGSKRSSGSSASTRYTNLLSMGKTEEANMLQQEFPNQITKDNTNIISELPDLTNIIKRTLKLIPKPRMQGDDVKQLQSYLNTKLNLSLVLDGSFGPKTKEAVVLFQLQNGLIPDGIVGPLTRAKLK